MTSGETWEFAWCFGHGRLHANPSWCQASWVRLEATNPDDAMAEKVARFGEAKFLTDLPPNLAATVPPGQPIP